MLWKGRRKRSGKLAVSAESEAALHLPARSRVPLDVFVFLLNTRAGSRVSHSPLLV